MRKSKEKYSPKKIKKTIIVSSIVGISIAAILISCLVYAYVYVKNICKDILKDKSTQELLNGNIINNMQISSYIYDKDGNQIGYLYGTENRVEIDYKDLPKNLVNAIISIEDERFFEHHGVDIKRTSAAVLNYLSNKKDSSFGGSSITQQLVKNLTDDDETSVTRKIVSGIVHFFWKLNTIKKIFLKYILIPYIWVKTLMVYKLHLKYILINP